jgi:methyl-accepting chemotaxis protein
MAELPHSTPMNANILPAGRHAPTDQSTTQYSPSGSGLSTFFRYHGVWAPGIRLFRAIGFNSKALVISAAFLLPIGLLAFNYFKAQQGNIDFSAKERLGVVYTRAGMPLLHQLLKAEPDSARTAALLADLEKAEKALGTTLGTSNAYAALKTALQTNGERAVGPMLDLLGVATDGSNLTLDPDIDTYYLMDAALFRLPVMADAAARVRDARPTEQRMAIEQAMVLKTNMAAMSAGLDKALAYNPELKGTLPVAQVQASSQALLEQLDATVLRTENVQSLPNSAVQPALDGMFQLAERSFTELDRLIAVRVGQMETARNVTAAVSVFGLLLALYLFMSFRRVLDGGLREVAHHIDAMRDGNLTTKLRAWGADEVASLVASLSGMQASLRRIVGQVRSASDNIVCASNEINSASADLSKRTEQSAANLEQTAGAMEEIAATVRQNEDTVREATRIADGNANSAEQGGRIIGQVVQTMQDINGSSKRIGDIIGTIDGIAFQTNILALNAAVEAARAGEQGRGFAVVASEVRALAQRSAAAAKEIKDLITASLEQVGQGTRVVHEAGLTIEQIVGSSRRVRELLAEVSIGASEQTTGIAQSTKAVQELDTVTQQNAALVEQTAAAAGSLNDQAQDLAAEVAAFRLPT